MATKLNKGISRLLLLSVVIYFAAVLYVGGADVYAAVRKVSPLVVLVPLLLSLAAYLTRFVRWQLFLYVFKKPVRMGTSLLIYFSGFALAMTPGKVGELLRCSYLRPYRISYKRSGAMFVVERFLDVISMLCLSLLALKLFSDKLDFVYLIMGLAVFFLLLVLNPRVLLLLRRRLSTALSRLGRLLRHLVDVFLHSSRILKPLPLLGGLGIGVVAWSLDGLGFYYITSHFVANVELSTVIGIYALSILLGAFSFMPGGVGATEALMYGFLHLLGVAPEYAVVIIILSRLTTIWFAVLLGAFSIMLHGKLAQKPAVPAPAKD